MVGTILSSCSLRTKTEYIDYLVSKFVLLNIVDYKDSLMTEHSYINTSTLKLYNEYFDLKESNVSFNYGMKKEDINFDFVLSPVGKDKIQIGGIKYKYFSAEETSYVAPNYEGEVFAFFEITVFPNYWLRIHSTFEIENETKDLIFEFKENGRNN